MPEGTTEASRRNAKGMSYSCRGASSQTPTSGIAKVAIQDTSWHILILLRKCSNFQGQGKSCHFLRTSFQGAASTRRLPKY